MDNIATEIQVCLNVIHYIHIDATVLWNFSGCTHELYDILMDRLT